jgi:hypothetical protein
MTNARLLTTDTAMNVPAASSQISALVCWSISGFHSVGLPAGWITNSQPSMRFPAPFACVGCSDRTLEHLEHHYINSRSIAGSDDDTKRAEAVLGL